MEGGYHIRTVQELLGHQGRENHDDLRVVPQSSAPLNGHDAGERHASYMENHVSVQGATKTATKVLTLNHLHVAHSTCIGWLCRPFIGLMQKSCKT